MKKHADFLGKSVLDFGCNTGGLLHHLPEIAKGCGTDIDEKCMVAARTLNRVFRLHKNLTFVAANLETCDLDMFFAHGPYDIVFLCSLGSWVKNWPRLYTWAITHSPIVFFEENNATEGKPQLDYFESNGCTIKLVTANSPDDNTGNRMRNMYIVYTPLFSAK
jgi:SAM-dependent methyltransferase